MRYSTLCANFEKSGDISICLDMERCPSYTVKSKKSKSCNNFKDLYSCKFLVHENDTELRIQRSFCFHITSLSSWLVYCIFFFHKLEVMQKVHISIFTWKKFIRPTYACNDHRSLLKSADPLIYSLIVQVDMNIAPWGVFLERKLPN